MEIKVNYSYIQDYLPTKRHRKIRQREAEDEVAVNIKELDTEGFPVAFIVHDFGSIYPGMKSYDDYYRVEGKGICGIYSEEIRTIGGKLYKPVRITHGGALSDIFEQPETYIKIEIERLMRCSGDWIYHDAANFTEKSVIVSDNKKERRNQARKNARNYIVCDRKVWSKCSEPRYHITTFGLGHNHGGTGFFIDEHYNPNIGKQNYFNALQYNEAVAYGKAVAVRRGDTESVDEIGMYDGKKQYIEVLMSEMVKCNPNKDHGDGNEFMNTLDALIDNSNSVMEAGLLCMAFAAASGVMSEK